MYKDKNQKSFFTSKICKYFIGLLGLGIIFWNLGFIKSLDTTQTGTSSNTEQILNPEQVSNTDKNNLRKELDSSTIPNELSGEPVMYIVFSTDCSFFQDWQSLVVFHSAKMIGQSGHITRIASGCTPEKEKELSSLYHKLYPENYVHFTPDFKTDGKSQKKYDFYNKPYGMKHWLEHASPPIPNNAIVALIDPDFVFLRKLHLNFEKDNNLIYAKISDTIIPPAITYKKGAPVAQMYGLGAPWANTNNPNFDKYQICGNNSPCTKVSQQFGADHYSVGPPYIMDKTDMLRLTNTWTEFVPRVYSKYPELLAEMYAYSMAAAHEELPHTIMEHYMVSNIDAGEEGWPFIDILGDDVVVPLINGVHFPDKPMPTFLHYCSFYRIGDIGFQKRRIVPRLFTCDNNELLVDITPDLVHLTYKNRDGEVVKFTRRESRRNTFMLSILHQSINAAIIYYRQNICGHDNNTVNAYKKVINLAHIDF